LDVVHKFVDHKTVNRMIIRNNATGYCYLSITIGSSCLLPPSDDILVLFAKFFLHPPFCTRHGVGCDAMDIIIIEEGDLLGNAGTIACHGGAEMTLHSTQVSLDIILHPLFLHIIDEDERPEKGLTHSATGTEHKV